MTTSPVEDLYGAAPIIDTRGFSDDEQRGASIIRNCLVGMASYVQHLEDAVALYDSCRATETKLQREHQAEGALEGVPSPQYWARHRKIMQVSRWHILAARDGAMSVYHFAKSMDGATNFRSCRPLISLVDREGLRDARKYFSASFPSLVGIRHAVSHAAEMTDSVESFAEHALKEGYEGYGHKFESGGSLVMNSLYNRTFLTMFEGRVLTYDLTQETLAKLIDITRRVYGTFPDPRRRKESAPVSGD